MSELQGLQSRINDFQSAGYEIIAVSPDSVAENNDVVQRLSLEFPILSDPELVVTGALGLVHKKAGMDGQDVPRPATFLIHGGLIKWRDLTDNWRVRIRADDLFAIATSELAP